MSKKPSEVRLGRLELQIMNVVWDRGSATVHDVKEALSRGRKPAYSTILTMMRKLEVKGYLKHEVNERTYVYQATISRQAARKSMLGDLLERVHRQVPVGGSGMNTRSLSIKNIWRCLLATAASSLF